MPKGKPNKGYNKSKYRIGEAVWHLRQVEKILRNLRWKLSPSKRRGGDG